MNLYRGNIRPTAFTERKKNAGCMDTEGGNNDKCSRIFKLCMGSLFLGFRGSFFVCLLFHLGFVVYFFVVVFAVVLFSFCWGGCFGF